MQDYDLLVQLSDSQGSTFSKHGNCGFKSLLHPGENKLSPPCSTRESSFTDPVSPVACFEEEHSTIL